MANLKEVRERIQSVISTKQITYAMKMVSAAKLRRAQAAIVQMRPYSLKLNEMLTNILSNADNDSASVFSEQREIEKGIIVVVTSNRGLCGAFNTNVIKVAVRLAQTRYAFARSKGQLTIVCIGKKGYDFFRRHYSDCTIDARYVDLFAQLNFENTVPIAQEMMTRFVNKEVDAINIAYGRFRNAALQFAEDEQFLPVKKVETAGSSVKVKANFTFEPREDELLEHLIPTILQTQFYKTLLDTHASEHGARMTAMDKASENADELLKDLKINYNKARQENITKELSEIVGGAAALNG